MKSPRQPDGNVPPVIIFSKTNQVIPSLFNPLFMFPIQDAIKNAQMAASQHKMDISIHDVAPVFLPVDAVRNKQKTLALLALQNGSSITFHLLPF